MNLINGNQVALASLITYLANFTKTTTFVCKEIRRNFRYENSEKTDEVESVTYLLADPNTLDVFKVKVPGNDPVTDPDAFAKAENTIKVSLPVEETLVKPYKIEHGKVLVSVVAPYVTLAEEVETAEVSDDLKGFTDLDD